MNGHRDEEAKGSWTAISRALIPQGRDAAGQGGLLARRRAVHRGRAIRLNDGGGHTSLRDSREVRRDSKFQPSEYYGGECTGVYYVRLLRDGWKLIRHEKLDKWKEQTVFEKPVSRGWTLRKIAHEEVGSPPGKGCYWDEHQLDGPGGTVALPEWEWAEVDGDRLVWTAGGKLFAGKLQVGGLAGEVELHDFNGTDFQPIAAPY